MARTQDHVVVDAQHKGAQALIDLDLRASQREAHGCLLGIVRIWLHNIDLRSGV
jgi:hypothetical protein